MIDDIEADDLAELTRSGLFDAPWYLQQNPDVRDAGLDPLEHYSRFGWHEGRRANAYFDPEAYLTAYPDVRDTGMNPLLHYLRHGEAEGRRPIWYFDPGWYRAAYRVPDGTPALAHYLSVRMTEDVLPAAEFYAVTRLEPYRSDRARGVDPFLHHVAEREQQGRDAFLEPEIVRQAELMDLNYYLINGTDVHELGLDPADHFCRYGWREGRKPNIYFDTRWYLETNPEVARLGINPLVHYILEGEAAGRRPVVYFDPTWYRATYDIPPATNALAHFIAHRRSQKFSPHPMFDLAWYVQQHADALGTNRDPFAHFLQTGTFDDIDPSPEFEAARYRRTHIGRRSRQFRHLMHPDKDNPLVHYLRTQYR